MKRKKLESSQCKLGSPLWKYARLLEEKRGHNYEYYNETKHEDLIDNKGWQWFKFEKNNDVITFSEAIAQEVVSALRNNGCFARIVCGLDKNVQKIKSFSVIYKQK